MTSTKVTYGEMGLALKTVALVNGAALTDGPTLLRLAAVMFPAAKAMDLEIVALITLDTSGASFVPVPRDLAAAVTPG